MNIYTYDEKVIEELRNKYFAGKLIVADFHRLHNMLWLWLSEHPGKKKEDWPLWWQSGGWVDEYKTHAYCFACTVVPRISYILICSKCPIDWGYNKNGIYQNCEESYFGDWKKAMKNEDFREASRIAAEIAGLSWEGQKEFILQKGQRCRNLIIAANRAAPRTLGNKG